MQTKHVVITGANRGIGLALTNAFLASGMRVTATCRNPDGARGLWELETEYPGKLMLHALDVSDADQIKALATSLESETINILINNAGVYPAPSRFDQVTGDNLLRGLQVNTLGPLFVTQALLPQLQRGEDPIVANISSKMGSITDNSSGGSYGYRMSKAALNMFSKSLAVDYPEMISMVLHPGWVQTDMGGPRAQIDVVTCANSLRDVILNATTEDSGKFYDYRGELIPW